MFFRNMGILIYLLSFIEIAGAVINVKIIHIKGDVKIRYGLEENWQHASIGMLLKEIDSIISGENSEVTLEIEGGKVFILGSNSMLDIGDLRKIYEKELFLYLMSRKIEQIEPRQELLPLRIGNVSVVHGESKAARDSSEQVISGEDLLQSELNGAMALFSQGYFPNTIVKLYKILAKYDSYDDCGKTNFYIAKSLEFLDMNGQALDNYRLVIEKIKDQSCTENEAVQRMEKAKQAIEKF